MGEIADQIVGGEICQLCLCPGDGPMGFPFTCGDCERADKGAEKPRPSKAGNKTRCPKCSRRVKKTGLYSHLNEAHPELAETAYNAVREVLRENQL